MTRFGIVVPAFNCAKFLPRCLESLETQRGVAFDVCVVDDASTDPCQRPIIEEFCGRNGWKSVYRTRNEGSIASIVSGFAALDPRDEDVIVTVDGDDFLIRPDALLIIARTYDREDSWLTYGQHTMIPTWRPGICRAIDDDVVRDRRHRQIQWPFSQPRTFKARLWRRVKDEDLRDDDGVYFHATADRAMMYPMVEMAGYHVSFISRILYAYDLTNPLSDFRTRRAEQLRVQEVLRRRSPRDPLPSNKTCLGPTEPRARFRDPREWGYAARRVLAATGRLLLGKHGQ